MDRLCRVCMDSSVTLVDIFAERMQPSNKDPSLAEMLNEFCEVSPRDLLPQTICLSCVLAAQNAYKFKMTCEESNRKLLELLAIRNQDSTQFIVPCVEAVYQNEEIPVNLNCVKVEKTHQDEVVTNNTPNPPLNVKYQARPLQRRPTNKSRGKQPTANEYPHKCNFCGKGFNGLYPKRVHEKRHTEEKTFFCVTCGKGFIRGHDLTIHTRIHTGERFQCPHCPRSFIQKHILRTHMLKHTMSEFRCEHCSAVFKLQSQLRIHQTESHGVRKPALKKHVAKSKVQNTKSVVEQKPQKTLTALQRGLRDKLPPVSYEELDLDCELNDIDTTSNQRRIGKPKISPLIKGQQERVKPINAVNNMEKHNIHFCDTCGRGFPKRYALKQHTRTHTGERPYKCSFCPSAFTQGHVLKRHIGRIHNNLAHDKELQIPPIKRVVVRVARIQLPCVLTY